MARGFPPFHGPRHLNRTPEQQEFFGEGGLARIGVRDDGEGAPFPYFSGSYVVRNIHRLSNLCMFLYMVCLKNISIHCPV
jgi:hypothetical protein